jgi:nucleoside-diphosphate-sugar epimerase
LPDFYGPHVHTSTLQNPLQEAVQGQSAMNWMGKATTAREYAFVPDAMRVVASLAGFPEAYGERWMFPGSGPLTGQQLATHVSRELNRPVKLRCAGLFLLRLVSLFKPELRRFLPMAPYYVGPISYDSSKLAGLVGSLEMTPYNKGIPLTLDWLKERS